MERIKRRWWTRVVSVLAALLIVAAALSGAFQFAVLALPSYRDDLSAWVTSTAGRPVQIGGIDLVWRRLVPQIDLSDITLYSVDGAEEVLSAERLSLGFGLLRLMTGDFTPTNVELSGLSLEINIDENGEVSIAGLDDATRSTPLDYQQWLKELARFKKLRLQNCAVVLTAPSLPEQGVEMNLSFAQISKTYSGLDAEANFVPPAEYGKSIHLAAELEDPVDDPAQWHGQATLKAKGLQPQPWFRGKLLPETLLTADAIELEIKAAIEKGRIASFDTRLQTGAVKIVRGDQSVETGGVDVLVHARPLTPGWQVDVKRLQMDEADLIAGSLSYIPTADGYQMTTDVDLIKLDHLMPWLSYWRDASRPLQLAARSSGELSAVQLRLTRNSEALSYSLHAQLKDIALVPASGDPGFSGLSGEITAGESNGHFQLGGGALTLQVPRAMKNPVPFDALTGNVSWQRAVGSWKVDVPVFGWKLARTKGEGRMSLQLPDDAQASPVLDLSARFSAADATALKPYMPLAWGAGLHDWINRAIVSGSVKNADLMIKGPLADFPFHENNTGEWRLDFDAVRVNLAFLPEWPVIDQLNAHLKFQGNGLDILADAGKIGGNAIEKVHARFDDFKKPLVIDGSIGGEIAGFYDYVQHSPLHENLAGLIANTSATGPAVVTVHLDIPLHDGTKATVSGAIALNGVNLLYKGLGQTIRDIRGDIGFNADGASAEKLTANFEDIALTADIQPQPQTKGVIKANFDYEFKPDGSGASTYIPKNLRRLIHGGSHWLAELPLGVADGALSLSSNLKGLALALPEPVGKSADQLAPLMVKISDAQSGKIGISVNYSERLSANIALAKIENQWKAQGVNLNLGKSLAPVVTENGIFVTGSVKELDVGAWSAALGDARQNGLSLQRADLHVGRALYNGQVVRDIHTVFTPDVTGWKAKLDGAGAEGDLLWKDAGGGSLFAHLKHFNLDFESSALGAEAPDSGDIFDPGQFPLISVDCEHFNIGDLDFGNLTLATSRIANGQRVDHLKLGFGKVTLDAEGEWKRESDRSTASLKFDLLSPDAASVLHALGFAQNLDAKQSHFTADLNWTPQVEGLSWNQARGRVGIDVQNGILKSIDPGAGRVLGLLNFYALPRRLSLDFRDVVKEGLAFDTIMGNFDLADGNANTSDLDIKGPSLRMEVRGRIGLAAHDYDQQVAVYPDYSTGIAVGATLAGGPIAGAIVLLAQQLLQKPLDQITELSYRITGPWDNPKVEPTNRPEPKPMKRR